MYAEPHIAG